MSCSASFDRSRDRLLAHLRANNFAPVHPGDRIGAEAECITALADAPLDADGLHACVLPIVRRFAGAHGWTQEPDYNGAPRFTTQSGGHVTFEPGGQIEYSTAPFADIESLLGDLEWVMTGLQDAARVESIRILTCGIEPIHPLRSASLQLRAPRYLNMHAYLARRSEAGPRMMLQTAALQISVDYGPDPAQRWWVLNAAAPYLTAIFANSSVYEGRSVGAQSFRALQWRLLDPARTGVFAGEGDPAPPYLRFALDAPFLFRRTPDDEYRPFGEWLDRGEVSLGDWEMHLSTLFPEVRPQGYLEVRCIDALPPRWYAAPIVLLAGLTRPRALAAARELLPAPDDTLLQRAARQGVHDPDIGRTADALFGIALEAATGMEVDIGGENLERAREYRERYTRQGRSPADEQSAVSARTSAAARAVPSTDDAASSAAGPARPRAADV